MKQLRNQLKQWLEIITGNEESFLNAIRDPRIKELRVVIHEVLFSSDWIAIICMKYHPSNPTERIRTHVSYDEFDKWIESLTLTEYYRLNDKKN